MVAQLKFIAPCLTAAIAAVTVLFFLQRNVPQTPLTFPEKPALSTKHPSSPQPLVPEKQPASAKVFSAPTNHTEPDNNQKNLQPTKPALETTAQLADLLDDGENSEALNEVRKLCQNSDREVRMVVAEAINWIGLPAAMDAAVMMDDPDEEVRAMAQNTFWRILHELDDPQLKKQLLETALVSTDPELRIEALDELLYLPDELSRELFKKAAHDPDKAVAEQARDNLSFISGE